MSGHDVRKTAEIISAYVANNNVSSMDLPKLIRDVHMVLRRISSGGSFASARPVGAVPVEQSVTHDFIVCLEDGKKFRSLKRHLASAHGMTPAEYKAKWGLPDDYPMVAPVYATQRSALARKAGLGRSRKGGGAHAGKGPR